MSLLAAAATLLAAVSDLQIYTSENAWLTAFNYVKTESATVGSLTGAPFVFDHFQLNNTEKTLHLVEKNANIKTLTYRLLENDNLFLALADVVDPKHWSYCDHTLSSGGMRRHCYSGDPILSDLVQINSSFYRGKRLSVSFDLNEHVGPIGMLTTESGTDIDYCGTPGWSPGDQVILSVKALPSLRVEVKDGRAEVWVYSNSVDTAGSIVLCAAIVVTLAHLTDKRRYVCGICRAGFETVEALIEHTAVNKECNDGLTCAFPNCETPHQRTELHNDHKFVQKEYAYRSIVIANSGLFSALRLTAGLLAAALYTIIARGDGVLIAQKELGDAKIVVAVALGIVVVAAGMSLWQSTTKRNDHWAHVAFLTCEILLLSTLAYSIPKSYGHEIVVASLFLTGIASSVLTGDACFQIYNETVLHTWEFGLIAFIVVALGIKIVAVMIYPMIVFGEGIAIPTAWAISIHLFVCVACLPVVSRINRGYLQKNKI